MVYLLFIIFLLFSNKSNFSTVLLSELTTYGMKLLFVDIAVFYVALIRNKV